MENTEKLIEAVKVHEMLYDTTQDGYRNKRLNNMKWDEIGEMLDVTGQVAKRKWKGLRDSYTKHLRSMKSTGQAGLLLNRYKSWPWAEQMSFLKPHIDFSQMDPNSPSTDNGYDVDEFEKSLTNQTPTVAAKDSIDMLPFVETTLNLDKGKRKRRRVLSSTNDHSDSNKIMILKSRIQEIDDEVDLLFKSFAKTVKKFSPQRKVGVKAKMSKLITDEELDHLNEIPATCSSCSSQYKGDQWVLNNMNVLRNPEMSYPCDGTPILDSVQNSVDSNESSAIHFLCRSN